MKYERQSIDEPTVAGATEQPSDNEGYEVVARPGSRINAKDAAELQPALDEARRRNGGNITAEELLDAATPDASPLHRFFEWDDAKAGREYRLTQARGYLRVFIIKKPGDTTGTRILIPVPEEETGRNPYRDIRDIKDDPDMVKRVVARALEELRSWRDRYDYLKRAFADPAVFDAIDVALGPRVKRGKKRAA